MYKPQRLGRHWISVAVAISLATVSSSSAGQVQPQVASDPAQTTTLRASVAPVYSPRLLIKDSDTELIVAALGYPPEKVSLINQIVRDAATKQRGVADTTNREFRAKWNCDALEEAFVKWHGDYAAVEEASEPARYAEGQQRMAQLREQVTLVREAMEDVKRLANRQTDRCVGEVATSVAALSPDFPADAIATRVKAVLYARMLLTLPADTHYGDFMRPIEFRQFLHFASDMDPRVASWLSSVAGESTSAAKMERIMAGYDQRLVSASEETLQRRARQASDRTVEQAGAAWSRYYEISRPSIDELAALAGEREPELGLRITELYRIYLCPELTGSWLADELAKAISAEPIRAEMSPAVRQAVDDIVGSYQRARSQLVADAFRLGLKAASRHGTPFGKGAEQDAYREAVAKIRACSEEHVRQLEGLLKAITEPRDLGAVAKQVRVECRRRGVEPFVRDDVVRCGGYFR